MNGDGSVLVGATDRAEGVMKANAATHARLGDSQRGARYGSRMWSQEQQRSVVAFQLGVTEQWQNIGHSNSEPGFAFLSEFSAFNSMYWLVSVDGLPLPT